MMSLGLVIGGSTPYFPDAGPVQKEITMADSSDAQENQPPGYVPGEVWTWDADNGGTFSSVNRPTSGAREDKPLTKGSHPFQLYSMGTPNGQKVTIMFEELLASGHSQAEYDAWFVSIMDGDQFGSGFVDLNPNSKIPALLDQSSEPNVRLFESGSILVYLAEKFGTFLPTHSAKRASVMNWLMWQMGAAPFLGGGFGHFYAYAPFKMEYPINRYTMEVKRQLHVLDTQLSKTEFIAGDDYSIADMAIYPWYGKLVIGNLYSSEGRDAQKFLGVSEYPNVQRWGKQLTHRDGVKRGEIVNTRWGDSQLEERHSAADIDQALAASSQS